MFRSGGKHRNKRFHEPVARKPTTKFENYGIITAYHGGARRYCTVQAYTPEDSKVVELKQVRMKGSITNPKCKQRIAVGNCVLLEYGEISLIYKNTALIPQEILMALENAAGDVSSAERGFSKEIRENDSASEEESDSEEEQDEEEKDGDLI